MGIYLGQHHRVFKRDTRRLHYNACSGPTGPVNSKFSVRRFRICTYKMHVYEYFHSKRDLVSFGEGGQSDTNYSCAW